MKMNTHEAKTHFPKIVAAVENGETVVICRNGKPVIDCVPIRQAAPVPFGVWSDLLPSGTDRAGARPPGGIEGRHSRRQRHRRVAAVPAPATACLHLPAKPAEAAREPLEIRQWATASRSSAPRATWAGRC